MPEDFRIQSKIYQLLEWLLPKSERFPKVYRNTLTEKIMITALDINEAIMFAIANQKSQRMTYLKKADALLNCLRSYLRLITQWQWLSLSQYEHVSSIVLEIGRMLGAWIKAEKAR